MSVLQLLSEVRHDVPQLGRAQEAVALPVEHAERLAHLVLVVRLLRPDRESTTFSRVSLPRKPGLGSYREWHLLG